MTPVTPPVKMRYYTQAAVFRFFPMEKRQLLVQRCPELRARNQRLPFVCNYVSISQNSHWYRTSGPMITKLTIDALEWNFEVFATGGKVRITVPTGRTYTFSGSEQTVYDLIDYFLGRPQTVVKEFYVLNYGGRLPIISNSMPTISRLTVRTHSSSGYRRELVLSFKDNGKFDSVEIDDQCRRVEVLDELKSIQTKRLKIWLYDPTFLEHSFEFKADVLKIRDETPHPERFIELCKQWKTGKYGVGSSYKAMYVAPHNFNARALWAMLTRDLRCEEKTSKHGKCLSTPIDGIDAELNISVEKLQRSDSPFLFRAHVMEVGSAESPQKQEKLGTFVSIMGTAWSRLQELVPAMMVGLFKGIFIKPPAHTAVFVGCVVFAALQARGSRDDWWGTIAITAMLRIVLWVIITPFVVRHEPYLVESSRRRGLLQSRRSIGSLLHVFCLGVNVLLIRLWVGFYLPEEDFYRFGLAGIYFLIYELIVFF